MRPDTILLVGAETTADADETRVAQEFLREMAPQASRIGEAAAAAGLGGATQPQDAPAVVVLLPSVADPLRLARRLRAHWPQAHLLLASHPHAIEALRHALGPAPMLGRHWALTELEAGRLARATRQALAGNRQRLQLRTTLAAANAQVSLTRTVNAREYQRLVASDHHLSNFLRLAQAAVLGLDSRRRLLFMSSGAETLLQARAATLLGQAASALPFWSPALDAAVDSIEGGASTVTVDQEHVLHGRPSILELLMAPVAGDGDGGISLIARDVTQQRRAQDELKQRNQSLTQLVAERTRELEDSQRALLQAQKLDAMGKLTGGVAHDFNNVLQIIGSNLHLLQAGLGPDPQAERLLRAAAGAVERGARLSGQLLAFARRQPLRSLPMNINRRVREMGDMLRRALGEAIEIRAVLDDDLWNTLADPGQLENVILNLAINARDAMPQGGRLTIETANATLDEHYARAAGDVLPGPYVMLAVSDTGTGMTADVLAQAFDPFFTTKPEGVGTGLGLSMAYGFAKQSAGHIRIYSEPGSGTSIKLYLPRSDDAEAVLPPAATGAVSGGSETILVVEDDVAVQAAVVQMLAALGYKVLRANDAQAALALIESGVHVDLLFTDVVMPGPLRSPELAARAKLLLPRLAVLFTSGYTHNAIVHGGRLDPGVELLSKPYRQEDLARKVRQMLAPAAAPSRAGPPRLLLVEDDPDAREATQDMIGMLGYDVRGCASAEEALPLLRAGGIDVLLTDIRLPGRSGTELALEAAAADPALKIVFVSGYGAHAEVPAGLRCWRLAKPYGVEELERLLSEITGRRITGESTGRP
ncbi:response regulator [Caenimonas terrae]|uniref:histidine kinase n=1 Tax=Caenimonas terrae TaxID=696074 RepID=A0ABW0NAB3_9BURK